jgi:hypothetical protein
MDGDDRSFVAPAISKTPAAGVKHLTPIRRGWSYRCWEGRAQPEANPMSTRRKMVWWFKFVISGRFLETFLNLRSRRS